MRSKKWLTLLAALVLIPMLSHPGRSAVVAQSALPIMKVEPAFDGLFKYGEWLPLLVEIENPGGDLEAELRTSVVNANYNVVYAVAVSLPAGAHKRVPLYTLPNAFSHQLEVRLVSGDKLLATKQVQVFPQSNITFLAGLLSDRRGALNLLNGMELPRSRPIVLVDLLLAELPERADPLNSFNLLVLNDVDTSQLSQAQAAALQSWVERGGRLVIGGGAGAARTLAGLPGPLQPVQLDGLTEVEASTPGGSADALARLGDFAGVAPPQMSSKLLLARASPLEGGHLVAGAADQPLLVERSVGNGNVDFVALDLAAAPFEGWSGTAAFWQALIAADAIYPENLPPDMSVRQMYSGSLYAALVNIPSLDLPSISALSILLGVYILLVGPANYFLLRRLRRLHLSWVTIPVLTGVFSAGAFGIGYSMRGNDLILNKIALVESQPSGLTRVTSFIGLFSPRRQSYQIEVQGKGLVSPGEQYFDPGIAGVTPAGEMVFEQGQPSVIRGLAVNQWSMQSFMVEDSWEDFGRLTGELRLKGDVLTGTVRNDSNYPLKDVVLTVNRRFQRLGDLAPGQEARVDLGLAELNREWYGPSISYKLYMEQNVDGRYTREQMARTNILDTVLEGSPWMATFQMRRAGHKLRGVTLFGWTDQAPPQVRVRGQSTSQTTTSLVYATLDIQLPAQGHLEVPPGLIIGQVVEASQGWSVCTSSAFTSIYLDNAEAILEFQLPVELRSIRVSSLKLGFGRDNPQSVLKSLDIYDWQQEQWTPVEQGKSGGTMTLLVLRNAEQFISPEGKVRLHLANEMNNYSCFIVDLGLEGER